MPWEIYERSMGYRDMVAAFAETEQMQPDFQQTPAAAYVRPVQ